MSPHIHFPDAEIERVLDVVRQAFAAGVETSSDEIYRRLAEPIATHFLRWSLDEMNRGTSPDDMGAAVVHTLSWLLGQASLGSPEGKRAGVKSLAVAALSEALSMIEHDVPVGVPVHPLQGGSA